MPLSHLLFLIGSSSRSFVWAMVSPLLGALLLTGMVCAVLCVLLAAHKRYPNAPKYGLLGLFLGVMGLAYVAGLPDYGLKTALARIDGKLKTTDDDGPA